VGLKYRNLYQVHPITQPKFKRKSQRTQHWGLGNELENAMQHMESGKDQLIFEIDTIEGAVDCCLIL
jgi:hypothetical protein